MAPKNSKRSLIKAVKGVAAGLHTGVRPTKDGWTLDLDPRYWKFEPPCARYPYGSHDLLDKPRRLTCRTK